MAAVGRRSIQNIYDRGDLYLLGAFDKFALVILEFQAFALFVFIDRTAAGALVNARIDRLFVFELFLKRYRATHRLAVTARAHRTALIVQKTDNFDAFVIICLIADARVLHRDRCTAVELEQGHADDGNCK